jgi:hypothetical protein
VPPHTPTAAAPGPARVSLSCDLKQGKQSMTSKYMALPKGVSERASMRPSPKFKPPWAKTM